MKSHRSTDPADVPGVARWDNGGRTATVFFGAGGRVLGATFIDYRPGWVPWEVRWLLAR